MSVRNIQVLEAKDIRGGSAERILLLYVLAGNLAVTLEGRRIPMAVKDLLVINPGESWQALPDPDVLLMLVSMEEYEFGSLSGKKNTGIRLSSAEHRMRDYGQLRFLLDSVTKYLLKGQSGFQVRSLYYMLWDSVCRDFVPEETEKKEADAEIAGILAEIEEHYARPLSLQEMAAAHFMSGPTFSRYFQKNVGMNYTEYLRKVRMEHARELLLTTQRPVTEIAYDCGFQSLSVFNKNFRLYFQKTPGQLRGEKLKEESGKEGTALKRLADLRPGFGEEPANREVSIRIRDGKYRETGGAVTDILNAGRAEDLLDAEIQSQLREAVPMLHAKYLRLEGLFSPGMRIREGHGVSELNFERIDRVLDLADSLGLLPLLVLSDRTGEPPYEGRESGLPGASAQRSTAEQVFVQMDEWRAVLGRFLEHASYRYTRQTVSRWTYEICADAAGRENGGIAFSDFYRETYLLIRGLLPGAQILSCGLTAGADRAALAAQLSFFKASGLLPDGLSLHIYPYEIQRKGRDGEEDSAKGGTAAREHSAVRIISDEPFVQRELEAYLRVMEEQEYPDTPLWVTEWNTSLSRRNAYNDSTAKGCHMLTQVVTSYGQVAHMGYSLLSDWSEQEHDTDKPFMGAAGLISKDGILKPALYALQFARFLGQRLVAREENYIVTIWDPGNYTILLFTPGRFGNIYRAGNEGDYRAGDLDYIFQDEGSVTYTINAAHLPAGTYDVCVFSVRVDQDNPLSEWKKLGYKGSLRPHEITYLKAVTVPRMETDMEKVRDGTLVMKRTLAMNEFAMILLSRRPDRP